MLFFLSLAPPPHLHVRPGGFIVYGRKVGDSLTNLLHPIYPPSIKHSLSHPPRPDRGCSEPPAWCSWLGWGWCFRAGCWDEQHECVIVTGHGKAKAASTYLSLVHPVDPQSKDVSLQGNRKPLWWMRFLGKYLDWDVFSCPSHMDCTELFWERCRRRKIREAFLHTRFENKLVEKKFILLGNYFTFPSSSPIWRTFSKTTPT